MKSGFQVVLRIKFLDFPRMSIRKSKMRGLENKIKIFSLILVQSKNIVRALF